MLLFKKINKNLGNFPKVAWLLQKGELVFAARYNTNVMLSLYAMCSSTTHGGTALRIQETSKYDKSVL